MVCRQVLQIVISLSIWGLRENHCAWVSQEEIINDKEVTLVRIQYVLAEMDSSENGTRWWVPASVLIQYIFTSR